MKTWEIWEIMKTCIHAYTAEELIDILMSVTNRKEINENLFDYTRIHEIAQVSH